ncbi:TetR/AcrR family transcriptional regulator [Companilactobacillus huachuanensis]|uniref:TetR/AcrR family transcriptional regulator n=1 Tax=Companilactobacillus huachuanensis TaxID=2559914 RepID=A0ABW1RNM7_9LACO|nr:TetR/AcrR family transcriptional regulator [Companilactobacillus huachuanensis]
MKKKDNEKYEKILNAAIEIIKEDGAATLSTTKVAKRVQISQSNIYIYFKNKDDLLKQIYQSEISDYQLRFHDILENSHSTLEKITEYIRALYDISIENPDSMDVIEQIKQIPDSPIDMNDVVGFESNPIVDLIKKGIAENILKDVNPNIYLTMIFNTIRMNAANTKNKQNFSSFDTLLDLFLHGILK